MDVVPVVIGIDVLLAHVPFVDCQRSGKCLRGPSVIANAEVDVAGHVDHVSRDRGETAQDVRAVKRFFRVIARFESVDVVVVGRGVIGVFTKHGFERRERVLAAGIGEEDTRLEIFRIFDHDFAQKLLFP